jgi:hypothetical protein
VVLGLVAEDGPIGGIAVHLGVGIKTVETHVGAVFRKLGLGAGRLQPTGAIGSGYLAETGGGPHQGNLMRLLGRWPTLRAVTAEDLGV